MGGSEQCGGLSHGFSVHWLAWPLAILMISAGTNHGVPLLLLRQSVAISGTFPSIFLCEKFWPSSVKLNIRNILLWGRGFGSLLLGWWTSRRARRMGCWSRKFYGTPEMHVMKRRPHRLAHAMNISGILHCSYPLNLRQPEPKSIFFCSGLMISRMKTP